MANYDDDVDEVTVNKFFKLSLVTTANFTFIDLTVSSFQFEIQTKFPIFMQNICKLILYICKIITQAVFWKSFQKCSLVNIVMQVFFKFNQILMNSTKVSSQNF